MIFRQLFDAETWTYTYLIADPISKEAVMIDPVKTYIEGYVTLLKDLGLALKYSLETHIHADHITAGGLLRQKLGATTGVSTLCGAVAADIQIKDGDVFNFGQGEQIKVIATPGHTKGSISFLWRDRLFTGDCLLIDGCGRTDFQGGDAGTQYDSIQKLFALPDDTLVYPGHDYQQKWISNIKQEKTTNTRLAGKSREQFIEIMTNLNLPKPRLIDEAVPANRFCGLEENQRQDAIAQREIAREKAAQAEVVSVVDCGNTTHKNGSMTAQEMVAAAKQQITEVNVDKAKQLIAEGGITVVDVREESEYAAGHIDNAILLPRGVLEFKIGTQSELADKAKPVMIYCRTGGRASLAAITLNTLGYTNVVSIAGGFEAWKQAV